MDGPAPTDGFLKELGQRMTSRCILAMKLSAQKSKSHQANDLATTFTNNKRFINSHLFKTVDILDLEKYMTAYEQNFMVQFDTQTAKIKPASKRTFKRFLLQVGRMGKYMHIIYLYIYINYIISYTESLFVIFFIFSPFFSVSKNSSRGVMQKSFQMAGLVPAQGERNTQRILNSWPGYTQSVLCSLKENAKLLKNIRGIIFFYKINRFNSAILNDSGF